MRYLRFTTVVVREDNHQFSTVVVSSGLAGFRREAALWSASGYVEGDGGTQTVSVPPTAIRIR